MKPEYIALIGVLASSTIGGIVAFVVAAFKSASDRKTFERQVNIQIEKHKQEILKERSDTKLDIAYKFAELKQKDEEAAARFLNEVSKEMAIGFLYLDDDDTRAKIWVRNNANILIGRGKGCDVFLSDQRVSRQHAVVHTEDNIPFIVPLNPTNTVRLDEEAIHTKHRLKNGSRLGIANYEFVYFEL